MPNDEPQNEPSLSDDPTESPPPSDLPPGEPDPFVFDGDDVPEYMRGKTPQQVADEHDRLIKTIASMPSYRQTPQQPVQQPMPTNPLQPPDPDLQFSNAAEWQRQYDAYRDAKEEMRLAQVGQQVLAPLYQQFGESAQMASRQDPKVKRFWDKYEPEILAFVHEQQANPQTKQQWDYVAKIVAADHLDEIAREDAQKLARGGPGAITEGGNQGSMRDQPRYSDAIAEFFNSNDPALERLKAKGITQQQARDAAHGMKLAPADYVTLLKGGRIIEADKVKS